MASEATGSKLDPSAPELIQKARRRRVSSKPLGPETWSSRDEPSRSDRRTASGSSRDMMNRSTSSPGAPATLKFTKTGRVSKASKGERVHACEECDKVYTRNEHLRRHQKNHQPGAFPCDVPGCGRSFFREDLLVRHKPRHNDPLDRSSRKTSIGSRSPERSPERGGPYTTDRPLSTMPDIEHGLQVSDADILAMPLPTSLAPSPSQPPAYRRYPVSRSLIHPQPLGNFIPSPILDSKRNMRVAELPRRPVTSLETSGPYAVEAPSENVEWAPSSPLSPGYESPNGFVYLSSHPRCYARPSQRGRDSSGASLVGFYPYASASRSPISNGSAAAIMPAFSYDSRGAIFASNSPPSTDISRGMSMSVQSNCTDPQLSRLSSGSPHIVTVEERDLMEQVDLATTAALVASPALAHDRDLGAFDAEQRYLDAYWQVVHPVWSVVHKPSFNLRTTTPLLRAAMMVLGAQSTGDVADHSNARVLHERCNKVLKKRTISNWHTFRICDLQAVVLVEVYSLFRSRRVPVQESRHFRDAFRRLASDAEAYPAHGIDSLVQLPEDYGVMSTGMTREIQPQCKQRLLVACNILDRQQSMLFGRPRSDCLGISGEHLPFPQSSVLWDMPSAGHHTDLGFGSFSFDHTHHDYTHEAMNLVPTLIDMPRFPHDIFRSLHMIACLTDPADVQLLSSWKPVDDIEASTILLAVEQSPRARLAYHVSMLCKHTPVSDLIAVAGESWVMGEKTMRHEEFRASQLKTAEWAGDTPAIDVDAPILRALYHALQIIDIVRMHPRTGLLFHDWSICLAAVVVWIRAYVLTGPQSQPRACASESRRSAVENEQAVVETVQAGPSAPVSWDQARAVLLWAKGRIQHFNVAQDCGLTNWALDVLGKLVVRGHEDNWLR